MSSVLETNWPDDITVALKAAGYTPQRLSEEALQHYAGVLYARHALTLEQAARLAALPLWDFLPILAMQGIPVVDYDEEETETELETARWLATRSAE